MLDVQALAAEQIQQGPGDGPGIGTRLDRTDGKTWQGQHSGAAMGYKETNRDDARRHIHAG